MAALFSELSNPVSNHLNGPQNGSALEDKRALELALELSLLNFGDPIGNGGNGLVESLMHQQSSPLDNQLAASLNGHSLNTFSQFIGNNGMGGGVGMNGIGSCGLEERTKKSQNMTECVPVPSSEHVAEIVGRQGKISLKIFIFFTRFLTSINMTSYLFIVLTTYKSSASGITRTRRKI